MPMRALARLEELFARWTRLQDEIQALDYARARVAGGLDPEECGRHLARLEQEGVRLIGAGAVAGMIAEAETGISQMTEAQRGNLREMKALAAEARSVPLEMRADYVRAAAHAELAWRDLADANDFEGYRPILEEMVARTRAIARFKGRMLRMSPYDALLEGWDQGGPKSDRLDRWANRIGEVLPALLAARLARQERRGDPIPLPGAHAHAEAQRGLGELIVARMGFDTGPEGLAEGSYPQSFGQGKNTRLLMSWPEGDCFVPLVAAHEAGHGLYLRGLPPGLANQPAGSFRGYGVHEGVALLWDLVVSRQRDFWDGMAPAFAAAYGGEGPAWSAQNLFRLSRQVDPGQVDFACDELTNLAHITARYRLERALVEGRMEAAELPQAWRREYARLTGGHETHPGLPLPWMRENHWPDGWWGNFPSYLIGQVTANQLWASAVNQDRGIKPALARGDFGPLTRWLHQKIFSRGAILSTDALLTEATGRPPDLEALLRRLARHYCGTQLEQLVPPRDPAPARRRMPQPA